LSPVGTAESTSHAGAKEGAEKVRFESEGIP
jgi:hypothetical protein